MAQQSKPDLNTAKNLINYVIYTFAAVISVLYYTSESKSVKALEACEEENKEYRTTNRQLINAAYKIKDEEIQKAADEIDSLSVESLKSQAEPMIKKIKYYTKKK